MKKDENILVELREISPTLAEMPLLADLFKVPDGYFDALPGEIIQKIRLMEEPRPSVLEGINKATPYQIPGGYFESFAAGVVARIKSEKAAEDISKELQLLSPLLSAIEKKPAFTVPENYFSELPGQVSETVRASESLDESMESLPSWLLDLKKKETYTVPQGYFERFTEAVLSSNQLSRPKAKVISLSSAKPWMKYAAAAAFTGVLLTIGFFTFNNKTKNNSPVDPISSLSKVSNQEMVNYLESQNLPVDETVVNSNTNQDLNDNDIKDLFDEIPDADLIQFANNGNGLKDL
jgi:hypothetical protein